MTPDISISRFISSAACTFWLSISVLLSKLWHIKRDAGYLFYTGNNLMHFIISSIICHVRWYQMFPDITFHLVSYLYLLIIIIPFLSKFAHIKRVAGYYFCTGSNLMYFIISSIIYHVRWYQKYPDIKLKLVSNLYLLIINLPFNFKIVAYKTSSWVFILLTSIKNNGKKIRKQYD